MQGGWKEDVESEKEEDMGVVEWVGVDREFTLGIYFHYNRQI